MDEMDERNSPQVSPIPRLASPSARPSGPSRPPFPLTFTVHMVYTHYMKSEPKDAFRLPPISAAAPEPLYQQVISGVKREVSEGRLAPGAPLPSFRVLAEQLLVSVITVKRAYEELEREGIIYRKQGLGTFVSENGVARSRAVKLHETEQLLLAALREGKEAGLGDGELLNLVKELLQRGEHDS